MMKLFQNSRLTIVLAILTTATFAQAAPITGTVTNKTNGKPSSGDSVVLVDVQAGMSEAATATTDAHGKYSLEAPGMGPYLIRVNHQGGTYFIAAPGGGGTGDVNVYDVSAKVEGVSIDADMLLVEGAGTMLRVQERYLVRNTSLPPVAQFSKNTFEIVLPQDAELDGASATRPGGLATNTRLIPLGAKGHYTFNVPIQPDQGEKETMFEVQYHIPYSGKYTFSPQLQMSSDNLVVYVPQGMSFDGAKGASFQPTQEDPRVQTFVAKGIHAGQAVSFTVKGEGQMPRQQQQPGPAMGQAAGAMGDTGSADSGAPGGKPGGGLGNPIGTPDPLSKYKWWILGGLAVLLAAAAAYLLRFKGAGDTSAHIEPREVPFEAAPVPVAQRPIAAQPNYAQPNYAPPSYARPQAEANTTLLNILKDEMFAIESEKLSGTITAGEYAEVKAGLEAVLKRALKKT